VETKGDDLGIAALLQQVVGTGAPLAAGAVEVSRGMLGGPDHLVVGGSARERIKRRLVSADSAVDRDDRKVIVGVPQVLGVVFVGAQLIYFIHGKTPSFSRFVLVI
jgi:hypothetical protein